MVHSLGDLYLLPPSPWAHRVILVQRHTQCTAVKIHEYRPVLTELWLRLRGFIPRGIKVTQPLLLPADGSQAIMDSHAISRALDARRAPNVATLFPPEHDGELRELVQAAETLACYSRGTGLKTFVSKPHIAVKMLFPKFLRWLPFTQTIASAFARSITAKYQPESDAADEKQMCKALDVVDSSVKRADGNMYLLGDTLTYADYIVSCSVWFLVTYPGMEFFEFESTESGVDEYPEIKKWSSKFIATFVTKDHLKWPLPRIEAN